MTVQRRQLSRSFAAFAKFGDGGTNSLRLGDVAGLRQRTVALLALRHSSGAPEQMPALLKESGIGDGGCQVAPFLELFCKFAAENQAMTTVLGERGNSPFCSFYNGKISFMLLTLAA